MVVVVGGPLLKSGTISRIVCKGKDDLGKKNWFLIFFFLCFDDESSFFLPTEIEMEECTVLKGI